MFRAAKKQKQPKYPQMTGETKCGISIERNIIQSYKGMKY